MTTLTRVTFVVAFALGFAGASAPAFATDTSQALKLCQNNPQCHSKLGENSIAMSVNGKLVVECERKAKGKCIVIH
jgi:hypothetical protein